MAFVSVATTTPAASLAALFALVAGIVAFVYGYPLQYGIVGIVFAVCTAFPLIPALIPVVAWFVPFILYLAFGITMIVLGTMTTNPVMALFITSGVLYLVAFVLSAYFGYTDNVVGNGRTRGTLGTRGAHTRGTHGVHGTTV